MWHVIVISVVFVGAVLQYVICVCLFAVFLHIVVLFTIKSNMEMQRRISWTPMRVLSKFGVMCNSQVLTMTILPG